MLRMALFSIGLLLGAGCGSDGKGTAGAGGQGAGGAGAGGSAPTATAAECMPYCQMALANCAGMLQLYPDLDSCMKTCAGFPSGAADGITAGDSVQCRTYHIGVAAQDPMLHCNHATDSGGGVCGVPCEVYCDRIAKRCPATAPAGAGCMDACNRYPANGQFGAQSGNTVQCRLYHVGLPAATGPPTHCPHTGTSGGGVCG